MASTLISTNEKIIIGLCGPEGGGKTTVAKYLQSTYGAEIISFAKPLKSMLAAIGVPRECLYGTPEQKEKPLDLLCGKSARWAMQSIGTEWGRSLIGDDLWVRLWIHQANQSKALIVVADDMRFMNEITAIHQMRGNSICICRSKNLKSGPSHPSEQYWKLPYKNCIHNEKDLGGLYAAIDNLLGEELTLNKKEVVN